MTISELVERAHGNSRAKGWYDNGNGDRNIPEMLCLIHSEVSEALEAYRDRLMQTTFDGRSTPPGKPLGFPSEIADIFIRLGDLCGYMAIPIEREIELKMAFNAKRPYRHGGQVA